MVPQALPETVYDIKYFGAPMPGLCAFKEVMGCQPGCAPAVRDTRRAGMLIGGTNKTHVVKYDYDVKGEDSSLAVRGLMALEQTDLTLQHHKDEQELLSCRSWTLHRLQARPTSGSGGGSCMIMTIMATLRGPACWLTFALFRATRSVTQAHGRYRGTCVHVFWRQILLSLPSSFALVLAKK